MIQTILKSRTSHILSVQHIIPLISSKTITYKKSIRQRFNDGINMKQQTVEINSTERIRRSIFYKDADLWSFYKEFCPKVKNLGDALIEGMVPSKDGPCIGTVESSNGIDTLKWMSYSQVIEQTRSIGSYLWKQTKLTPLQSKVAIISSNSKEYFFVEQACYMYGFIVVSLYTTFNTTTIMNILQRTQAEVLVVDNLQRIESIQNELLNNDQIKEIIVLDDMKSNENNNKIRSLSTILKSIKTTDICERPTIQPDDIATFILTSGTTGDPKVAMLTHDNILATARGHLIRLEKANIEHSVTKRHCSFLPMAHIYERFVILQCLLHGAQIVFCPTPEKLPSYLLIVKPTQACLVPRVLNRVYDATMTEVKKSKLKQFLVKQALREQPSFLSDIVFRKVRKLFGNELKAMMTGSAPITPDVLHFFRIAFKIPVMEGYGQTESSGAGTTTHPIDVSYGTIGSPIPTVEIKLIDVPGTDYRSEQNQGEVCIRGPTVFKGYYNDDEKTREVLDKDGWLRTGDVGEWTNTGALRIIDRAKNIFKLSQGKYIAPERLEDIYIRSEWVAQIFVDGNSNESTVVAIVIPDEAYVRKHFKPTMTETSFDDLCKDEQLKKMIFSDLNQLADKYNLKKYETMSDIYLHPELFSQTNGLLTVTLKTRRAIVRKNFESIIKSLYDNNKSAATKIKQK
ncbi:unnamed protein product [Adineta steineri]|uniref:long-chain-fatty-acid--CoA ligase n=1 Tax=Adineta steineri TaxID=433720 RepID=A0A815CF47_9BILA|nr:unnamed protein product [Adineta steineri]CAF3708360.1 unnamed protein product [Adineta steineri]